MIPIRIVLATVLLAALDLTTQASAQDTTDRRPNVLFIAVDDLRPALGCYGDTTAVSPNIDRLAVRGTVFLRAYCQQAVCCPSRLSLLTGLRPDTIEVWDLGTHFRKAMPSAVTLPQHFKNNGYETRSLGKIFHGSGKPSKDPPSWSVEPKYDVVRDPKVRYAATENLQGNGLKRKASESVDVPDETYIDGIVCHAALEELEELSQGDRPFFLAVGFRKPHLPFCAPKKYWDLYARDRIPPPISKTHPRSAPEFAVRSWRELEGYQDIPADCRLTAEKVQELRHGYYACVSYVDSLVGRILDHLETQGLADKTIVCLWGDHGYHLGEQGLWTKANNYELSTRAPLIISVPGQDQLVGKTNALVEFVDVYPTLADLCGLKQPDHLAGISLKPWIMEPTRPGKKAVFSQYPRAFHGNRHKRHGDIMGYAVRTSRYRYIEWQDWKTKKVLASEIYDHQIDPHEMDNLSAQSEYASTIKDHAKILADHFGSK